MNTNKLLLGALAGGVTYFLLGYILYGNLLAGFFASNAGTAQGAAKAPEEMVMWALVVGNLVNGLLLAVIYERWANIRTFATGAKAGAVIGLLMALAFDLIMFGTSNVMTLTASLVDPLVYAVISAVAGGVVGWALGYKRA